VIEEMAVKGPAAGCIGGDEIAEEFARFDVDRVLVGTVVAMSIVELAPEPVQMDRCSIIESLISTKRTRSSR
jgi:hypothetical protein